MSAMATTASLHKNKKTTLGRIKAFINKGPLTLPKGASSLNKSNCNIPSFSSELYSEAVAVKSLEHWALPGTNGSWKNYSFKDITSKQFLPTESGQSFGPTWSTHWFKIQLEIPSSWTGKEVHLRWNSNSEASIWNSKGAVLAAFSPDFRNEYVLSKSWNGNEDLLYYVEMACNGLFGGMEGDKFTISLPDSNIQFTLNLVDVAVFDPFVFKLFTDIEMLYGMATELPENDHRAYQAMFTANEMINLIIKGNKSKASDIADTFFSEGNGIKAHSLIAMGHCHIDTAWLWPYDETIRKCARSWVSQILLMKEYPEYVFTCSQAQQFDWVKQFYPDLYSEIKTYVRQGRFIPVGGTWVEMDGLIPSGESFIRQFFYGQKFFKEEFGIKCKEFWLPDTFGYSGQIPQILKHVGIDRFLTQKLSWSLVNRFPHHNFLWEGIDGSQVLVHFPPGDSYEMKATVAELVKSVSNSLDKGRANVGAFLFGFGDGGGGPTSTMIERLKRVQDVDGLPKVTFQGPDYLFNALLKEQGKLCKWVGELYLELHNGTYTSQAKIKWYNRKSEFLLKEIELVLSIAYTSNKVSEDQIRRDMETVDKCWKNVLLNQFHDVLPGSCVELVKDDAWRIYEEVFGELMPLRNSYHKQILGPGNSTKFVLFNPLSWDVKSVIFNQKSNKNKSNKLIDTTQEVNLQMEEIVDAVEGRYQIPNKFTASLINLKASGYSNFEPLSPEVNVITSQNKGSVHITNGIINVRINQLKGVPVEYLTFKGRNGTEIDIYRSNLNISPGMFYIYDDVPLFWDAWDCMDYHLETRQELSCVGNGKSEILAEGPIVAVYKWSATFGNNSFITRYTIIRADSPMLEYYVVIDWKESHKFLKVEFPVDILAREATFEIQFGHLKRPTHINTSWDMAKFEVSGHKWMDISQTDKGVTFITDSKHGWHVRDNVVQLSLLRSPKSPDGNCDIHKHFIHYAVFPHEGTFQDAGVIKKAYELNFLGANNVPFLDSDLVEASLIKNLVTVKNEAVILETVKVAADITKAICVRMYESFGGSTMARVQFGFTVKDVVECNGLEEPTGNSGITVEENAFLVQLNPFQIKSFLIYF